MPSQNPAWTIDSASKLASFSVASIFSLSGFGGKPARSSKATPGVKLATCACSCLTVWEWLALTILRDPSCRRSCSVVWGRLSSTLSVSISEGGGAGCVPEPSPGRSRMLRPAPENGVSLGASICCAEGRPCGIRPRCEGYAAGRRSPNMISTGRCRYAMHEREGQGWMSASKGNEYPAVPHKDKIVYRGQTHGPNRKPYRTGMPLLKSISRNSLGGSPFFRSSMN
mmetsp:Transcript_18502/g.51517  ORF Transcript_18502/g.51517 Transcript_18502/m.51517 type:complete len:226 (-) Transcript_18502:545-1222(-)